MLKTVVNTTKFINSIKKLKDEDVSTEAKKRLLDHIRHILLDEKGLIQKIGQNIGHEFDQDYLSNDHNSRHLSDSEIRSLLSNSILLNEISIIEEGFNSGSLAQVNRIKLNNGQQCALKLKYPNIEETLDSQIKLLKAASFFKKKTMNEYEVNLIDFISDIETRLKTELNYKNEVLNLKAFKEIIEVEGLRVPEVYEDLSTDDYITMEWVDGKRIHELTPDKKKKANEIILQNFFENIFLHGMSQGDNHLDNYLYNEEKDLLYLLDLGHTITYEHNFRKALYILISSYIDNTDVNLIECLRHIGFDSNKLGHIETVITPLIMELLEPFKTNTPYNLSHWKISNRIDTILGENKWWFRSAGSPLVFQFLRSLHGLMKIISDSNCNINFHQIFHKSTQDFRPWLTSLKIKENTKAKSFKNINDKLIQIIVLENNKEKVKAKLPLTAIFELDNFINDDIKTKLANRGISINQIIDQAKENNFSIGSLFELDDSNKVYKVDIISSKNNYNHFRNSA